MRFLPVILLVVLVVYALIDCVRSDDADLPAGLPKAVWVILIVVFPGIGALAWLVVSRVHRQAQQASRGSTTLFPRGPGRPTSRRPAPRPVAPDDDPEFLASLDRPRRDDQVPPGDEGDPQDEADGGTTDSTDDDGGPATRR